MYNAMLTSKEVLIGGTSFYISPFPVFAAARITAHLSKTLSPVLGGLIALIGDDDNNEEGKETGEEENIANSITAFTISMGSLNPAEFEKLARELLVNSRNIAFKNADCPDGEILTEDAINALFAGNTQNMYILAFHVIKENYSGFFEKFKTLSGNAILKMLKEKYGLTDTESSMSAASAT